MAINGLTVFKPMMENGFRNVQNIRKNVYDIIISPIYHNIKTVNTPGETDVHTVPNFKPNMLKSKMSKQMFVQFLIPSMVDPTCWLWVLNNHLKS